MPRSRSDAGRYHGVTRREFLGAVSASIVAAACQRPPYDTSKFRVPDRSAVALLPADSYSVDFADVIGRGLHTLGVDVRGKRVLLKPNMVEYERDTAINTNPLVVAGAAVAFRSAGAREVIVGEGPGHRRDLEYLLGSTGLYDHLKENRIRFVDLNHDDVRSVALGSHFTGLSELSFPVELLQSDFIVSMPKLKTHHWAGMTASMKNFFGTVPGAVYGWPKNILHMRGIENSIVDLNATLRPHFAIIDGVTGMEGDGPIMGKPRHVGFVGMSTDLVALDATCARIIGLDPGKLGYIDAASRFLGNASERRIDQRAESLKRYATRFEVTDAFKSTQLQL